MALPMESGFCPWEGALPIDEGLPPIAIMEGKRLQLKVEKWHIIQDEEILVHWWGGSCHAVEDILCGVVVKVVNILGYV